MAAPTAAAAKDLRRVMTYIVTNPDLKIKAHVRERDEFEALSDSDHAGDKGLHTRSTTGIIIFYNGAPIEWLSKKQTSTSLSSAEAKIYALSEAAKTEGGYGTHLRRASACICVHLRSHTSPPLKWLGECCLLFFCLEMPNQDHAMGPAQRKL